MMRANRARGYAVARACEVCPQEPCVRARARVVCARGCVRGCVRAWRVCACVCARVCVRACGCARFARKAHELNSTTQLSAWLRRQVHEGISEEGGCKLSCVYSHIPHTQQHTRVQCTRARPAPPAARTHPTNHLRTTLRTTCSTARHNRAHVAHTHAHAVIRSEQTCLCAPMHARATCTPRLRSRSRSWSARATLTRTSKQTDSHAHARTRTHTRRGPLLPSSSSSFLLPSLLPPLLFSFLFFSFSVICFSPA